MAELVLNNNQSLDYLLVRSDGFNKMVSIILNAQYYTIFPFTGFPKREHEVPETMFSVSSAESQNELVFHQMQRIVDNDLL